MRTVLITTMVMLYPKSNIDYVAAGRKMLRSYLKHTPHHMLIVTNQPQAFEDIREEYDRLIVYEMPSGINKFRRFDYTLKLEAIAAASTANVDAVYWVDADHYTTGWHEESFQECLSQPYDVIGGVGPMYRRDVNEWKNNPGDHPLVALEGEEGYFSHGEGHVIYNNMEKLKEIAHHWQTFDWDSYLTLNSDHPEYDLSQLERIEHWRTKEGCDGIMMGSGLYLAGGSFHQLREKCGYEFTEYERIVKRANHKVGRPQLKDRFYRTLEEEIS